MFPTPKRPRDRRVPERAVELIAESEEERDGESVVHVKDKEHGYDIAGVSPMEVAVGDFIA